MLSLYLSLQLNGPILLSAALSLSVLVSSVSVIVVVVIVVVVASSHCQGRRSESVGQVDLCANCI